jgi:hypothetical protein
MSTSIRDMSTSIWDSGGTWGTSLYTVRGVGSESRDVDPHLEDELTKKKSQKLVSKPGLVR